MNHRCMYGGRDAGNQNFDEIWILSLPSFTWTRVWNGTSPRFAHTCHLAGSRTLFSVDGVASATHMQGLPDTYFTPCDHEIRGLGLVDISTVDFGGKSYGGGYYSKTENGVKVEKMKTILYLDNQEDRHNKASRIAPSWDCTAALAHLKLLLHVDFHVPSSLPFTNSMYSTEAVNRTS